MLPILETWRILRLLNPGRLLPWIGPAFRGLVARRFKEAVCRFPLAEQQSTWKYCKGCPHMASCPYGQTIEADPPRELARGGEENGVRPLVMAPLFAVPEQAPAGLRIPVRAIFAGDAAASHAERFWRIVEEAGRDPQGGLGQGVMFRVEAGPCSDARRVLELPARIEPGEGYADAVRVELTSPLILRRGATDTQKRQIVREPSFGDLLRAGLRTLGALGRYFGQLPEVDFAGLRQAAEAVPLLHGDYGWFEQGYRGDRREQCGTIKGVIGAGVYGPVPSALLRWVRAAGLVHVGLHRVSGAGGWRVSWATGPWTAWQPVD